MASTRYKHRPPEHVKALVCNHSERRVPIRQIAVHSTESADVPDSSKDLLGIQAWFNNPASHASSHIGVDGDGQSRLWVYEHRKAWTIGAANGFTLNIEFVARAAQSTVDWEEAQIKHAAKWAAYWGIKYDIPAGKGYVKNINGLCVPTKSGVIRHSDVTSAGFGSHTDPGSNFPMADFLRLMAYFKRRGWTL